MKQRILRYNTETIIYGRKKLINFNSFYFTNIKNSLYSDNEKNCQMSIIRK